MESLAQLALIWAGTFVAVIVARATRLTPVVYYLGIGAIFVNLNLLPRESGEFIRGLSEVGIIDNVAFCWIGPVFFVELAFVVLDIAYVQNSILNTEAFYTLMITCFFLNIAVPITIHLWKGPYQRERAAHGEIPGENPASTERSD